MTFGFGEERKCSECKGPLEGKRWHAETCGDVCRQRRSRRLKREALEAAAAAKKRKKSRRKRVKHARATAKRKGRR